MGPPMSESQVKESQSCVAPPFFAQAGVGGGGGGGGGGDKMGGGSTLEEGRAKGCDPIYEEADH